jgi:hypothetical protein
MSAIDEKLHHYFKLELEPEQTVSRSFFTQLLATEIGKMKAKKKEMSSPSSASSGEQNEDSSVSDGQLSTHAQINEQ